MVKVLDLSREETKSMMRAGKVTICVIGLGYVGLPLAILFASEGARVIGCVRTEESAEKINSGTTSIVEHDVSSILRDGASTSDSSCPNCGVRLFRLHKETFCPSCGRLASITNFGVHLQDTVATAHEKIVKARQSIDELLKSAIKREKFHVNTQTTESVRQSDVVLITVGTPVDEKHDPDYSDLRSACENVGKGLEKEILVVLKSTVSPGTTRNFVKPILEDASGLKAGENFGLAFIPETIKEGHALHEFRTLPRIAGGITKRCANAAVNVFSVFPAPIYIYNDTTTVEAAKLFMNIYRDVNIALVNELALASEKLGFDVIQAINAANIDPKTHLLTPGLVGGYCLPKDTYQLSFPSEKAGFSPLLITMARQLNDKMPKHVLDLVDAAFKDMKMPLRGARIAILGVSFKANSGDLRNTPAGPIIMELESRGAVLVAHDPFVQFDQAGKMLPNVTFTRNVEEALKGASCTLIITDHLEYRGFNASYLKELMSMPCAIVDARHIIDPAEANAVGIVYRGLGKPERGLVLK
jgi:UDP-N-acetyl-D-mannosaminuronic acid dehydrogenase